MNNILRQYSVCVMLTHLFTLQWNTVYIQQWASHIHNGNALVVYMIPIWYCKVSVRTVMGSLAFLNLLNLRILGHVVFADRGTTAKMWQWKKWAYSNLKYKSPQYYISTKNYNIFLEGFNVLVFCNQQILCWDNLRIHIIFSYLTFFYLHFLWNA